MLCDMCCTYVRTHVYTYMYTYKRIYIHAYVRTYVHTTKIRPALCIQHRPNRGKSSHKFRRVGVDFEIRIVWCRLCQCTRARISSLCLQPPSESYKQQVCRLLHRSIPSQNLISHTHTIHICMHTCEHIHAYICMYTYIEAYKYI